MMPHHLLALYLALLTVTAQTFSAQSEPPDFWWDLTLNHSASISTVLRDPTDVEDSGNPKRGSQFSWNLGWAAGTTDIWKGDGSGLWTIWTWKSKRDSNILGGGFLFNMTGEKTLVAGVSWLHEKQSRTITWNCFAEGNYTGDRPWADWGGNFGVSDGTIDFVTIGTGWGFYVGSDLILSKHCANGIPVYGKRFKYQNGKEIETPVQEDPFKTATFSRKKRSPDFFDKIGQKVKELYEKAKKLLGIGQQQQDGQGTQDGQEGRDAPGQRCNSFLDFVMRIINLIFGRRRTPGDPPSSPPGSLPAGTVPPSPGAGSGSSEDDAGGDPPTGANVPPADAEELDPAQNDAVRDWE